MKRKAPTSKYQIKKSKGHTSLEFGVLACLVALATLSAVFTLGNGTQSSFDGVASGLSSDDSTGLVAEAHEVEQTTESPDKGDYSNLVLIAQSVCLVVLCSFYFYSSRRRESRIRQREEQTEAIQKQSLALQKVLNKRNAIFHKVDEDLASIIRGHALVGTYMSTDLVAINDDMPKEAAIEKMRMDGFRRFMVRNQNGDFAGVVSKKDILSNDGELVRDVMTSAPKTVTPTCEIASALTLLLENRISCLPVVAEGKLVGLLSVSDLLMVLQCLLRDLQVRSAQAEQAPAQHQNATLAAAQ